MHSQFHRCFKASLLEKVWHGHAAVQWYNTHYLQGPKNIRIWGTFPYPQQREMGHRSYIFLMRNQSFTEN